VLFATQLVAQMPVMSLALPRKINRMQTKSVLNSLSVLSETVGLWLIVSLSFPFLIFKTRLAMLKIVPASADAKVSSIFKPQFNIEFVLVLFEIIHRL